MRRSGSTSAAGELVQGPALVLLDANALLLPFRRPFPLVAEIHRLVGPAEVQVPASVLGELRRLVERRVPGARPALELANRFPEAPGPGLGDRAVLDLARERRAVVVTADRGLRDRLLRAGVTVLSPRGGARLAVGRATADRRRPGTSLRATVKKSPPVRRAPPTERGNAARRR